MKRTLARLLGLVAVVFVLSVATTVVRAACDFLDPDRDGDNYSSIECGGTDCDDRHPRIHPGARENCNDRRDDDCDGLLDDADPDCACQDADRDGYPSAACGGTDCNDKNKKVAPGAVEDCADRRDNDCDGLVDGADPSCGGICPDDDLDEFADAACGGADCDDGNASIHPGAAEDCANGEDDDCNGELDGTDPACGCPDDDGDGVLGLSCGGLDCDDTDPGVNPGANENCSNGTDDDCDGMTDADDTECRCADDDQDGSEQQGCGGGDCDDGNPEVHPGATEQCLDGLDNDCDGLVDGADPSCGCPDQDLDGSLDAACGGTDCNDANPIVHPGATEACFDGEDNDCDGLADGLDPSCVTCEDADQDGYPAAACGGPDCDDTDPGVHPSAPEDCLDGLDNDCNGRVDGEDAICAGCWDVDQDGHDDGSCGGDDCNDNDPGVRPDALEVCTDTIDNNCDGLTDGQDPLCGLCWDADLDGHLDAVCGGTDCNDADSSVNPIALETCGNGVDDNCDGLTDPSDLCEIGCPDNDSDSYQDLACGGTDCDDLDADVHPGAVESCANGRDDDCNGAADVADPSCGCVDADLDGVLDAACGGVDCNDADPSVFPGAPEICDNGIDDDCDGHVDGADPSCGCPDADLDGHLDAACGGTDCNDADPIVHPGALEACEDGEDNDCNGAIDGDDPACGAPEILRVAGPPASREPALHLAAHGRR